MCRPSVRISERAHMPRLHRVSFRNTPKGPSRPWPLELASRTIREVYSRATEPLGSLPGDAISTPPSTNMSRHRAWGNSGRMVKLRERGVLMVGNPRSRASY